MCPAPCSWRTRMCRIEESMSGSYTGRIAPPGRPNMTSTPSISRLLMRAWAPVSFIVFQLLVGRRVGCGVVVRRFGETCVGKRNDLPAGRSWRTRGDTGVRLGDEYEKVAAGHHVAVSHASAVTGKQ